MIEKKQDFQRVYDRDWEASFSVTFQKYIWTLNPQAIGTGQVFSNSDRSGSTLLGVTVLTHTIAWYRQSGDGETLKCGL